MEGGKTVTAEIATDLRQTPKHWVICGVCMQPDSSNSIIRDTSETEGDCMKNV